MKHSYEQLMEWLKSNKRDKPVNITIYKTE